MKKKKKRRELLRRRNVDVPVPAVILLPIQPQIPTSMGMALPWINANHGYYANDACPMSNVCGYDGGYCGNVGTYVWNQYPLQ